jgi:hypothetical protein
VVVAVTDASSPVATDVLSRNRLGFVVDTRVPDESNNLN